MNTSTSIPQPKLNRKLKKVLFCVIGNRIKGSGHVFRALSLAKVLLEQNHEIQFVTTIEHDLAIDLLKQNNYYINILNNWLDIESLLSEYHPTLIINDILHTSSDFMKLLTSYRITNNEIKIVNFEDVGDQTEQANLVINALLDREPSFPHHHSGHKYIILNPNFLSYPFRRIFSITRILITFGGTDPSNISSQILPGLMNISMRLNSNIEITVVIGPGFDERNSQLIKTFQTPADFPLTIKSFVKDMAKEMNEHDLIVTGNGRTVFEATALGIPVVMFAQNKREEKHVFSMLLPNTTYMGRFYPANIPEYNTKFMKLITDYEAIHTQNELAIAFGKEIREGVSKIVSLLNQL